MIENHPCVHYREELKMQVGDSDKILTVKGGCQIRAEQLEFTVYENGERRVRCPYTVDVLNEHGRNECRDFR